MEGVINTTQDEKFPHLSLDEKLLFFSSEGHENAGGFDVFKTRRTKKGYVIIVNLGNTINYEEDEIAFILAIEKIGYITSNREGGKGVMIPTRSPSMLYLSVCFGVALGFQTKIPVSNALICLIDTDGTEVATTKTDTDGVYNFQVSSFEHYTVVSKKMDFTRGPSIFITDNVTSNCNVDVTLKTSQNQK